jgi:hypothetical protein
LVDFICPFSSRPVAISSPSLLPFPSTLHGLANNIFGSSPPPPSTASVRQCSWSRPNSRLVTVPCPFGHHRQAKQAFASPSPPCPMSSSR